MTLGNLLEEGTASLAEETVEGFVVGQRGTNLFIFLACLLHARYLGVVRFKCILDLASSGVNPADGGIKAGNSLLETLGSLVFGEDIPLGLYLGGYSLPLVLAGFLLSICSGGHVINELDLSIQLSDVLHAFSGELHEVILSKFGISSQEILDSLLRGLPIALCRVVLGDIPLDSVIEFAPSGFQFLVLYLYR